MPNLTAAYIELDSCFALVDEQKLLITAVPMINVEIALQYFSRAIVQEPKNLRMHIQRIFLILSQVDKNTSALASAIADLLIVLEQNGSALKARILEMSKCHLHTDDWLYLKKNEQCGLTPNTPCGQHSESFYDSVLSNGLIGHAKLIKRKNIYKNNTIKASDLHKQALVCLEYGQLEVALNLLTKARVEDPTSHEIGVDLLSIYISLGMELEQNTLIKEMQDNIN